MEGIKESVIIWGVVERARKAPNTPHQTSKGRRWDFTGEEQRLLRVLAGEMKRMDIQRALALRHEDYFREAYLLPALTAGLIEMTIPGKPTSSKQKYLLTKKGQDLIAKLAKDSGGGET